LKIILNSFFQKNKVELQTYFSSIQDECVREGNLHGILLTGLSKQCISLFQSFVDIHDDVQTVSLAIIHSPYNEEVLNNKQVINWINSYRDLLNQFQLWEKR
jgi:WD repeat-containing protein mio